MRQLKERATRLFCGSARRSGVHPACERKLAKDKKLQRWNAAPLNFVSLRSSLHYVGLEWLSRVEMNAPKTGRPGQPLQAKGRSTLHCLLDTADDFIDGVTSALHSACGANRPKSESIPVGYHIGVIVSVSFPQKRDSRRPASSTRLLAVRRTRSRFSIRRLAWTCPSQSALQAV